MSLPIIILGGGGHAKVLTDALRVRGITILGITDADPAKHGSSVLGIPLLGNDTEVERYAPGSVQLVNGIGSVGRPTARAFLFDTFKTKGYTFATVVHPSAVVADDAVLGEGVQVMAGAVVQPGTIIGKNSIVNTRGSVDHDCLIGEHVHIAPGVTPSGGVRVGSGSFIGAGATVIHGVMVGADCLVAAGSVVLSDIRDKATVMGVPAREIET